MEAEGGWRVERGCILRNGLGLCGVEMETSCGEWRRGGRDIDGLCGRCNIRRVSGVPNLWDVQVSRRSSVTFYFGNKNTRRVLFVRIIPTTLRATCFISFALA